MTVPDGYRTVQMFVSPQGVYEVSVASRGSAPGVAHPAHCTCPSFAKRRRCRHTEFVVQAAQNNGGDYPIQVGASVPQEARSAAVAADAAGLREFVLRYGRVLAL